MSYSNGTQGTYRFPATTVSGAGVIGRIKGPAGLSGRLVSVSSIITTATTGAASAITVGNLASTGAYGSHSIPVGTANVGQNALTQGAVAIIPADDDVLVSSDGGSTLGAADIIVLIEWS